MKWLASGRGLAAGLLLATVACAGRTRTLEPSRFPTRGGDGPGYRFQNLTGGGASAASTDANRFFVCLTFSGGGTRAAAMAYGAMIALRQARIDWPRRGETLLDEVDCISSVSGGSFTAAYYGLFHDRLFDDFASRFLYRNVDLALGLRAAAPWNWFKLWSPYFSRIDLAADFYDGHVFDHATYGDLTRSGRRPYVILNATNVATGTRFPFTQDQFDLIGSDLDAYPVARAVAASSAFPFLLSPLTLENHQPLPGFPSLTEYRLAQQDYYTNRDRYYWSQVARAYVEEPHPWVHVLDGGLADNIGLRPIVNAYEQGNGFISRNARNIDRLAIISINARTKSKDTISDSRCTPHIVPTVALATATTSMDNYSFATVDLADRLMNDLRQARRDPGPFPLHVPYPYVMEISFEAIADPKRRDAFYGVATDFALPEEQVTALVHEGCELLKNDPEFRCMLEDVERAAAGQAGTESACDEPGRDFHPRAAEAIVCPPPGEWPRRPEGQGAVSATADVKHSSPEPCGRHPGPVTLAPSSSG